MSFASPSVAAPPALAEKPTTSSSTTATTKRDAPPTPNAIAPAPPSSVTPEAATMQCLSDIQQYISSEMSVQQEEWLFVDKCNATLRARYSRLNQRADVVTHAVEEARKLVDRLPEYYSKVDELERTLDALELVTSGLDNYSKVLEKKFCTTTTTAAGGSVAATATPPTSFVAAVAVTTAASDSTVA